MANGQSDSYKTFGEDVKKEEIQQNQVIAVESGQSGFQSVDGDDIKIKIISGVFGALDTNLFIPHGITGNPASNNKIRGLSVGINNGIHFFAPSISNSSTHPAYGFISDATVSIKRGDIGSALTAWAMVFYVE